MHLVVARVTAKIGHCDSLLKALRDYTTYVLREEHGTLYFDTYRDAINASRDSVDFVIL